MRIIKITERVTTAFETNIEFPIYRSEMINEDHRIYWKFESHHKVTKIVDQGSEMSIMTYQDENADFVESYINSRDFLFGKGNYDVIPEKIFDNCLQRIIDLIHRS